MDEIVGDEEVLHCFIDNTSRCCRQSSEPVNVENKLGLLTDARKTYGQLGTTLDLLRERLVFPIVPKICYVFQKHCVGTGFPKIYSIF